MVKDACPKPLHWIQARFGEAGEAALGAASWSSFSGFWGIGTAPSVIRDHPVLE